MPAAIARRWIVQIIMSVRDYIKNIAPTPVEFQATRDEAKRKGTSSMSMREIDRVIAAMIRVVIDTNVVVSATARDEGLPAAILDLVANTAMRPGRQRTEISFWNRPPP